MSQTLLLFLPIGGQELLIIALLIFLLFGATRLPQLAKALGQSKKAFREGIEEGERDEAKKEPEKLA
jgi:sec-independent protein translocase protein TatA